MLKTSAWIELENGQHYALVCNALGEGVLCLVAATPETIARYRNKGFSILAIVK